MAWQWPILSGQAPLKDDQISSYQCEYFAIIDLWLEKVDEWFRSWNVVSVSLWRYERFY